VQGVEDLLAEDPGARWDQGAQTVENSAFGMSPRIALVPFFDPTQPPRPGRNWVRVVRLGVLFIERITSNEVVGRFMTVTTPGTPCTGSNPGSAGAFIRSIALIQ
jgi:hypothetical protein